MDTANFSRLIALNKAESNEEQHTFNIKINPEHSIFEGHFPERAILPGVVMVEIFKRAVESVVGKPVRIQESKSLKFLKMVEPAETTKLQLSLKVVTDGNGFSARGELHNEAGVYFKEMASFVED
ncbi:MAG: hypothetical protein ABJF04_03905 [Reichenbachiella sp.]|uniref:hypothetical protein n=1 Tax=Reichenbachiella sp. TaxID=2184521 RepID=UPI0032662698